MLVNQEKWCVVPVRTSAASTGRSELLAGPYAALSLRVPDAQTAQVVQTKVRRTPRRGRT